MLQNNPNPDPAEIGPRETPPGSWSLNDRAQFEAVPQELKDRKQWVCYRLEMVKGKLSKVPYSPNNPQRKASSTDPATWGTFEEALATAQQYGFDGIGYVFSKSDPNAGIDLDNCRDPQTGEIDPWAQVIIYPMNSYTEVSPSGRGVHIFTKGELAKGTNKEVQKELNTLDGVKRGVEIYSFGRYFTITGNHLPGTPLTIEPRQTELDKLYKELNPDPVVKIAVADHDLLPEEDPTNPLSDAEIVTKLSNEKANGTKWAALLAGDISGYKSASQADEALCCKLAFYTRKNPVQIDRIFRRSGLYRDKWDSKRGDSTYGAITIDSAISRVREVYDPKTYARDKDNLPVIPVNNRQLRDSTADALQALYAANNPPKIFMRSGNLCRIKVDEDERPFVDSLIEPSLRLYLSEAANFIKTTNKGGETKVSPPSDLVQTILAASSWKFPPLRCVVEGPVLRMDGSILSTPGYDPTTKLYYRPMAGRERPSIPSNPSQNDAERGAAFIKSELLCDFPWADTASFANFFAGAITPIVRAAIDGNVPLAIFDAPTPGTGKTILAEIIGMISTGRWTPLMSAPSGRNAEEEWIKIITSSLMTGGSIVCFDNCEGILRAAALSKALTNHVYSGRILGVNKVIDIPANVSWYANGNNLQVGGDLTRRCYWVRLDSKESRPWERTNFKQSDLGAWVTENQGKLVAALLTMAKAWFDAGKPQERAITLGSFEKWARTVGGILNFAGIEGFLGNQQLMYRKSNVDDQEAEAFLLFLKQIYGDSVFLVRDLVLDINSDSRFSALREALPADLADALEKCNGNFATKLGRWFVRKEKRRFGDEKVRVEKVEKAGGRTGATGWKVLTG